MRLMLTLLVIAAVALVLAVRSDAHLVTRPTADTREAIHNSQSKNLFHARYVCERGAGAHKRWACHAARGWLLREWKETLPPLSPATTICQIFGSECAKAIRVARCESNLNVHAVGNRYGDDPYYGLFQQGAYSRSRYGFGWTAIEQARGAKRHRDAEGWGPWPVCGLR